MTTSERNALTVDQLRFDWDYVDRLRDIATRLETASDVTDADPSLALSQLSDALALAKLADVIASYLPPREK